MYRVDVEQPDRRPAEHGDNEVLFTAVENPHVKKNSSPYRLCPGLNGGRKASLQAYTPTLSAEYIEQVRAKDR